PLLGAAAVALAILCAWEMAPAARRLRARAVLLTSLVALEAVFVLVLPDRTPGRFVYSGLVCLSAGLIVALPTGVLAWVVLRRGAVLDRASAAAAIGGIAGLAGLGALEIHCPNL